MTRKARHMLYALALAATLSAGAEEVTLTIVETSDVHGCYYPYDFINRKPTPGSLARVDTYLRDLRAAQGADHVIYLDNGDILQGQPTAYYYNFIDTLSPHLTSAVMNYLGVDAASVGNHDIETGHAVYDRWVSQNAFPTLGANVIDASTGKPYLQPYTVIERGGVKVAVIGLLTPGIPGWLPETLWHGLRFDDMAETAAKWVDMVKAKEKPDLVIGLFHSGRDSLKTTGDVIENASMHVAQHVPGFDIVMMGHDHSPYVQKIVNDAGQPVIVVNPGNNARAIAEVDVTFGITEGHSPRIIAINGGLVSMDSIAPSQQFLDRFDAERDSVDAFVSQVIGHLETPLTTRDAYFGSSAFIDFIHSMQLDLTGADISFAAPLTFDATIDAGDIKVSDMFNLYKYENMLYTMRLTGREVKDYLEMAYDLWINQMKSPADHLLRLRESADGGYDMTHTGFQHPSYNFDSAAGIIYTVDVTRPRGERVDIISMADGTPFDPEGSYLAAVNSYRGNGGGNLLTEGAGIPHDELRDRVVSSTDRDLRYYLMRYIIEKGDLAPTPLNQWRFIPEDMVAPAAMRDRELLFGN